MKPEHFTSFYILLMVPLLIRLYYGFVKSKYELFLLDFCYFTNLSVAIQVLFYPNNLLWFQVNYVVCLGPISMSILFWRFSVAFHSLTKLTSFFVHAFPPIVMHLNRWKLIKNELPLDQDSFLPWYANFIFPFMFYAVWQIAYLFIVEVVLKEYLKDQAVVNSLRYLLASKKNPIINLLRTFLRNNYIIKQNEDLDPNTTLGKFIFVFCQAIYTVVSTLHIRILYAYYWVECVYLIFLFLVAIWNGSSVYMKLFCKKT